MGVEFRGPFRQGTLADAAPPEVAGSITASTLGSEISFWETTRASPGPFSTGVSACTSWTLSPYFFDRTLIPYFVHVSCSWPMKPPPPVSGVTIASFTGPLQLTACVLVVLDEPAPAVAASAAAPSAASASTANARLLIP